jgi:hypothetical protein
MILEFTLDFHGPDLAGLGISIRGHPYAKQSSLNFGSAAHMLTSIILCAETGQVQPIVMNVYSPFGKQVKSVHRGLWWLQPFRRQNCHVFLLKSPSFR